MTEMEGFSLFEKALWSNPIYCMNSWKKRDLPIYINKKCNKAKSIFIMYLRPAYTLISF